MNSTDARHRSPEKGRLGRRPQWPEDITAALGTQDYWRLRLGIGHPRTLSLQQQVADFVLHRPRREDQELIEQAIENPAGHAADRRRQVRGGDDEAAYGLMTARCARFAAAWQAKALMRACQGTIDPLKCSTRTIPENGEQSPRFP
jgi:hypothetical protein